MKKTDLQRELFNLADEEYRAFHSKLMPTVPKERVIGVRTPALRKFADDFMKKEESADFLGALPHYYYEENNLHAFLLEKIMDYDKLIKELNAFLPFVDNWATCDMMKPAALKKNRERLLSDIEKWLNSDDTYAVRFGINCLMTYYLDDMFEERFLERVAAIKTEEYYIKMMIAWYFATALFKQYYAALKILLEGRLDKWTHNKAIQKARESNRTDKAQKDYLKTLKY